MATSIQHVPAWKRLGLKLKNAPELTPETTKRKRETEEKDSARVKKAKMSEAISADAISSAHDTKTTQPKTKRPKHTKQPPLKATSPSSDSTLTTDQKLPTTPKLTRQKSVTFTPETKKEDGDSIKQLFNAWLATEQANDPTFQPSESQQPALETPEAPKVEEVIDEDLPEKERKVKRVKEKKEKKAERRHVAKSPDLDPALTYLDQFCNSRDTWKFNKIHQINLLKNVYNEKLIPSANIEQFYTYIKDLKGQARTLLRDSALKVKVQDREDGEKGFPKKLDNPTKAQSEYDHAVNEYVVAMTSTEARPASGYEEGVLQSLSEYAMRPRMVKRMRAERLLAELAQGGDEVPRIKEPEGILEAKTLRPGDGKVVRKRKQRTNVDTSSDSSSSDSSDSDSDSESNSDDGAAAAELRSNLSRRRSTAKSLGTTRADTSSSEDSDSSSSGSEADSKDVSDSSSDAETDSDSD